jgi:2-polyprenyl-3-methyl-5-hydroxy-6-metoxy-1,4-benzoquinol methylase
MPSDIAFTKIMPRPQQILAHSHGTCYLCGREGKVLFSGLPDKLFGVPGSWDLRRCSSSSCGLVWLDPQPDRSEWPKLYARYYTHEEGSPKSSQLGLQAFLRQLMARLSPLEAPRKLLYGMYLDSVAPGRLLELGCGNGDRLSHFLSQGWQVEGQEVDEHAALRARRRLGVPIHLGELAALNIANETYDAVVMSHVIEHVPDPIEVLAECRRILKPSGRIVVVTPNMESMGACLWGKYWRGLEPPRHMMIHSRNSLQMIAERSGFSSVRAWNTAVNSGGIFLGSLVTYFSPAPVPSAILKVGKGLSLVFAILEIIFNAAFRRFGEECVLVAKK